MCQVDGRYTCHASASTRKQGSFFGIVFYYADRSMSFLCGAEFVTLERERQVSIVLFGVIVLLCLRINTVRSVCFCLFRVPFQVSCGAHLIALGSPSAGPLPRDLVACGLCGHRDGHARRDGVRGPRQSTLCSSRHRTTNFPA